MFAEDKLAGFNSLGEDINHAPKGKTADTQEGAVSSAIPELELSMSDEELLMLKKDWEKQWGPSNTELQKKRDKNEKYWLGKHYGYGNMDTDERSKDQPLIDNVLFEAVETYLPMATKQNPDPDVTADNTAEGQAISYAVKQMLIHLADKLNLRLCLKAMARNWLLYYQGVAKVGWSLKENEVTVTSIRPQRLILDPNCTIENGEYTGEYIGEIRLDTAGNLKKRFPSAKEEIDIESKGEDGTKIQYAEWWTNEMVFWTLRDAVLGKSKNPHWNYPQTVMEVDEYGFETPVEQPGKNHFAHPKMPYIFLSVLNLGNKPYDDTSLFEQNISAQDRINKRLRQIDLNVDAMNGGLVMSGQAFTKEQAADAVDALRRGAAIVVPNGDVNTSIKREMGQGLPADVYNDVIDTRNELKGNFGIRGSTAGGIEQEKTVRGKLLIKSQDGDRIGGGFSEYLEQSADGVYNWWLQLMYVYYDEPHVASVVGQERAQEYISLSANDLDRELTVTVNEGSLIPRDSMSKRAEAIELYSMQALDPISLFTALEYPNPREMAKSLMLWQQNPMALFPELAPPPMAGMPPPDQAGTSPMEQPLPGQPEPPLALPPI